MISVVCRLRGLSYVVNRLALPGVALRIEERGREMAAVPVRAHTQWTITQIGSGDQNWISDQPCHSVSCIMFML